MTERVYLHVGAPKSGTTYLQAVLRRNRARLADAGVLVVGERHLDVVHAGLVVREDPRVADLGPRAAAAWERMVHDIRTWQGPVAVLSYELFSGASREQARAVLDALDGLEVHLVYSVRDLARAVPSAWQERLKFALTAPLHAWTPPAEEAGSRAEWGWRTMDPVGVLQRWAADLDPSHVHVVTVPRSSGDATVLWKRFAEACDLGAHVRGLDLAVPQTNESLGPVPAELLRRVNAHLAGELTTNAQQARWIRNTLAHEVLVPLGRERLGITDAQLADAESRSERAIDHLRSSGYDVRGDLEDVRATRPEGRMPSDVAEADLLATATEALARLLLLMRERVTALPAALPAPTPTPEPEPVETPAGPTSRQRARDLAYRVVGHETRRVVDSRLEELEARVRELEQQVQEDRALHRRVAALDDLVCELLLPTADQDDDVVRRSLAAYHQDSL